MITYYCITVLLWAVYMIGMSRVIFSDDYVSLAGSKYPSIACAYWMLRAVFWPLIPVVRLLEAVPLRLLQAGEPT